MEWGHRTWLKDQLVCLWGAPSPVYKGGEEEAGRTQGACQGGGLLLVRPSWPPHLPLPPLYTGAGGHLTRI